MGEGILASAVEMPLMCKYYFIFSFKSSDVLKDLFASKSIQFSFLWLMACL